MRAPKSAWSFGVLPANSGSALLGLAVASIALAGVAVAFNSETLLRSSFKTALGATQVAEPSIAKSAPIAGSEDFWLSAIQSEPRAPLTKAVSVGDKISMTLGGLERTLEVASVSEFSPKITEIDTSEKPSHFVLVTAKDLAQPAAKPIRFVVELDSPSADILAAAKNRAL